MARARGQASRSLLNRKFPHRVVVPANSVSGRVIEEVGAFHRNRGVPVKYHSLRLDDQWYSAYCFAEREAAEEFQVLFGGELANTES
jgi:hypothetical protein